MILYILSSYNFLLPVPLRFQRVSKRISNSSYRPEILLLCIVKLVFMTHSKSMYLDTMPCARAHRRVPHVHYVCVRDTHIHTHTLTPPSKDRKDTDNTYPCSGAQDTCLVPQPPQRMHINPRIRAYATLQQLRCHGNHCKLA